MSGQNNEIKQVYALKEVGYEDLAGKLVSIKNLFTQIKEQKQQLNALKGSIVDPRQLSDLNRQMDQLTQAEDRLQAARKRSNNESGISLKAFRELNQQYEQAVKTSQELATRFGTDSEFAKAAATSAAEYKQQLVEINNLVKNGGKVTPAAGSYAETLAQYKELFALLKTAPKGSDINFLGNTLGFDQAIEKLKVLAATEQKAR